jgi:hypothetical protein
MLIALLVVVGVNLIVIVVLAAIVLGRKRWLKRQAGEFVRRGAGVQRRGPRPQLEVEAGFGPLGARRPRVEQGAVPVPR